MSAVSPSNGSAAALRHAAADRHAHETLHDFLLRRHDEMTGELVTLHAQIARQAESLEEEHHASCRRNKWLIAGLALDATSAMLMCLAGIFAALPVSVAAITLAVVLAGNLLAIGMPHLETVFAHLRPSRRR